MNGGLEIEKGSNSRCWLKSSMPNHHYPCAENQYSDRLLAVFNFNAEALAFYEAEGFVALSHTLIQRL